MGGTQIGDYSFSGNTGLTTITISGQVTSIGQYAFNGCTSLSSVVMLIATNLTTISTSAFYGCTSLTTLDLSKTNIGDGSLIHVDAFAGSSLTTIIVPNSVPPATYNSWAKSSAVQVVAPRVVCFMKGSQILTSKRGYVAVEMLSQTDKLINHLGKEMNVFDVSMFVCERNKNTHPYLIPKGTPIDSSYKCITDLYLSPCHEILIGNKFVAVKDLGDRFKQTELDDGDDKYEYYHITTDNYFTDVIMANGVPCEGFGKYMCDMNAQFISELLKEVRCNKGKARKLLSTAKFMRLLNDFIQRKSAPSRRAVN
jgi:hypothetical protein